MQIGVIKLTFGDMIIIILCFILLFYIYKIYWVKGEQAGAARITVMENKVIDVDLSKDQVLSLHGRLGESLITVKDRRIRFTHSPCKGKVCIHSGWLADEGDFTACLPNQISIELKGKNQYDAIAY